MRPFLKTRQFGRLFGLRDRTVRAWIASKKIEVIKVGAGVRIPASEVERLIREGRRPAAASHCAHHGPEEQQP